MGNCCDSVTGTARVGGRALMPSDTEFTEETVVIDGVTATRRRKASAPPKAPEYFLHIPMKYVEALSIAKISAAAWSLALWVLWHHTVTRGKPATISATFAARAGIKDRSARRHAVELLEASGFFKVTRKGKEAAKITLAAELLALGSSKKIAKI